MVQSLKKLMDDGIKVKGQGDLLGKVKGQEEKSRVKILDPVKGGTPE